MTDVSLPKSLQGTLWSVPLGQLDIGENRVYIIHQLLAFGTLTDLRWLFSTYDKETIREVFLKHPTKIYTRSAFHFSRLLLDVSEFEVPVYRYDRSVPRRLR